MNQRANKPAELVAKYIDGVMRGGIKARHAAEHAARTPPARRALCAARPTATRTSRGRPAGGTAAPWIGCLPAGPLPPLPPTPACCPPSPPALLPPAFFHAQGRSDEEVDATLDAALVLFRYIQVRALLCGLCCTPAGYRGGTLRRA